MYSTLIYDHLYDHSRPSPSASYHINKPQEQSASPYPRRPLNPNPKQTNSTAKGRATSQSVTHGRKDKANSMPQSPSKFPMQRVLDPWVHNHEVSLRSPSRRSATKAFPVGCTSASDASEMVALGYQFFGFNGGCCLLRAWGYASSLFRDCVCARWRLALLCFALLYFTLLCGL